MKGLFITVVSIFSLSSFAGSNLSVTQKSSNGNVFISMKNTSQKQIFCIFKVKSEHQTRDVASESAEKVSYLDFSAYESKSMALESNFGVTSLEDISFNCVER